MFRIFIILLLAGFGASSIFSVQAQAPIYFPAEDFGHVNKSFTESSQNQETLEILMRDTDVFEDVVSLASDDPNRLIGRSVAMLDLLVQMPDGQRWNPTCTATRISPEYLITNYHCVPGRDSTLLQVKARFGYLNRDNATGQLYEVQKEVVEADRTLDYAILKLVQIPPEALYPALPLSVRDAGERESLFLLHHPAGFPQKLTRIRCQAGSPPVDARQRLVHHCDTLGGSSGTAILALSDSAFTALHHAGVPDNVRPRNLAIPMSRILDDSSILRSLLAASARETDMENADDEAKTMFSTAATACEYQSFVDRFPGSHLASAARRLAAGCGAANVSGAGRGAGGASADEARLAALSAAGVVAVSAYHPGETFRDTLRSGGTGPEMTVIPSGSFMMGSPANEAGRFDNEGPQRRVTIGYTFAVGTYEVSWADWETCVNAGSCEDNSNKGEYASTEERFAGDAGYGRNSRPVIHVSWHDAQAYVAWLSRETGATYRLPSEAEWEYAARARTTGEFNNNGSEDELCSIANVGDSTVEMTHRHWNTVACDDTYLNTAPVGSFDANAFGLHDMHGNVYEWVEDWHKSGYGHAPSDGSAFTNCSGCSDRVTRGGSWASGSRFLRSASRDRTSPDYRRNALGFRLARVIEE